MSIQTKPIIFKITEAGKDSAQSGSDTSVSLKIDTFAVGTSKYTVDGQETALRNEAKRFSIVSSGIELESRTLQFNTTLNVDEILEVNEIGLFTDTGVLFAVATSDTTEPLFIMYPSITFVAAFGLSLDEVEADRITVITDPNNVINIAILQQHLAAPNPHPQYVTDIIFDRHLVSYGKHIINYNAHVIEYDRHKLEYDQHVTDNNTDHAAFKKWQRDHLAATNPHNQYAHKVGDIYTTTLEHTNSAGVNAHHGYGTWQRFAEGRTLVGMIDIPDYVGNYSSIGNEFGEDEHTLTTPEMPSHIHDNKIKGSGGGSNTGPYTPSRGAASANHYYGMYEGGVEIEPTGNDLPHNNIQPSIVVAYWLRTA
jgi:hypothetical protein